MKKYAHSREYLANDFAYHVPGFLTRHVSGQPPRPLEAVARHGHPHFPADSFRNNATAPITPGHDSEYDGPKSLCYREHHKASDHLSPRKSRTHFFSLLTNA
ncbi:protein of unknown function [Pararobbsia alpina]